MRADIRVLYITTTAKKSSMTFLSRENTNSVINVILDFFNKITVDIISSDVPYL